jgi:hypothetical protein
MHTYIHTLHTCQSASCPANHSTAWACSFHPRAVYTYIVQTCIETYIDTYIHDIPVRVHPAQKIIAPHAFNIPRAMYTYIIPTYIETYIHTSHTCQSASCPENHSTACIRHARACSFHPWTENSGSYTNDSCCD